MSFNQSMCWIFDCCDSDLDALFWRYTYLDLTDKLRRKVGEFTTGHLQQVNGLIRVAGMMFGSGEKKERIVEDPEEFNRLMQGG